MQDERIRDPSDEDTRLDGAVLSLLLEEGVGPWSIDEVAREIGDQLAAEDAIARLYGAGLVHRIENFVFATRAAACASRLA